MRISVSAAIALSLAFAGLIAFDVVFVVAPTAARPPAAITFPVVRCPMSFGGLGGKGQRVPPTLTANVSAPLARRVVFYSNGGVSLLGPQGWHCKGGVGADGNLVLDVLPPDVTDESLRAAAVTALIPAVCSRCIADVACPFFPEARFPGIPCRTVPARERVQRLSARAVVFEDPPRIRGSGDPSGRPYPADGVVMFKSLLPTGKASTETCTLPPSQHAVCAVILNDFRRRFRP